MLRLILLHKTNKIKSSALKHEAAFNSKQTTSRINLKYKSGGVKLRPQKF